MALFSLAPAHSPALTLDETEFSYTASRASGPGGQHVNTTSSRVTLRFDVAHSPSLTETQRERIREKLAGYMDSEGVFSVSCDTHRSQHANRREALERALALLEKALSRHAPRRSTRPTLASKTRRLSTKKQRSQTKRLRGKVQDE